jgi:hypothetical protein
MVLTPNYDVNELSPRIIITDRTGVVKYIYETTVTTTEPNARQDFTLSELKVHSGSNSDHGYAILKIDDRNNDLTDVTNTLRDSKIERQWDIQIYFGKSQPLLQRWFYGKIFDVDIVRPFTNQQHLILSCVGWGSMLRDRITNIKRFQAKAADGITLDATDTTVKVSELVKDIIEDTDHQADHGLDNTELGITVNNVQDIDVKLPDLQKSFSTYATALSELSTSGNAMWGIDADRDLFLRDPGSVDSGFLFTNDLEGDTAQNWDSSRIGYLINASQSWRDSSYDGAYSILHGLGSNAVKIDQENSGSENAIRTSNTSFIGIPFTPSTDNIGKISLRLGKTGTPTSPITISVVGINASDSNSPKMTNLRKSITLDSAKIQSLSTSGGWVELGLQEKINVEPGTPLALVINKYGSVSSNLTMDYRTGTGTFWTSTDGVDANWVSATGLFSVRDYSWKSLQIILENTRAKAKYGTREKVVQFNSGQEEGSAREALISAGEVLGLERRFYSQVTISPPTLRIPLGQYCRIHDTKTGLSVKANIISTDISMSGKSGETSIGADRVTLGLEEVHY